MRTHRPYELQEYDPEWKKRFRYAVEKVKPILGDNLVEIEHIGSTSIEGMIAKPQVDILATVKDLSLIPQYYDAFRKAGFIVHGREYVAPDDEYISEDTPEGRRLTAIHMLQEGNPKINDYKVFRDYLKVNKEDRELYIATKRKLYSLHHQNYPDYNSGKNELIEAIKTRAKEWASSQHD